MFADLAIAIIFVIIAAAALIFNSDKIEEWAESTRCENFNWED